MPTIPHSYIQTDTRLLSEYTDEEITNFIWYSKIELRPGIYTQSFFSHKNDDVGVYPISMIRHLLKNINPKELTCLDFGTMNGVLPTLLAKRGGKVYSQESMPEYYATVNLVREAYNVNFVYDYNSSLFDLKKKYKNDTFDIVLFCGFFYHLINPFIEFAIARSFVAPGGLLIFETRVSSEKDCTIKFCESPGFVSTPSISFLEKMCRIFSLKPIDMVYIGDKRADFRVAFVCRAVTSPALSLDNEHEKGLWWNIAGKLPFAKIDNVQVVDEYQFHTNKPLETTIPYCLANARNLVSEEANHDSSRLSDDIGISLTKTLEIQPTGETFIKPKEILRLSDEW